MPEFQPIPLEQRFNPKKLQYLNEGVTLLNSWIIQLIEQGFQVLQNDKMRLQEIASRLVDFGLPSIARKIRTIPDKINKEKDWIEQIGLEMGELFLFCKYYSIFNSLNYYKQEDLLQYIGISLKKLDVKNLNIIVKDHWIYLGNVTQTEENLNVRRNWFYGSEHNNAALYLEFKINRFQQFRNFYFSKMYSGEVYYYPGSTSQRVTDIPEKMNAIPSSINLKPKTISSFKANYVELSIKNPWLKNDLCILYECSVVEVNSKWYLQGTDQNSLLISNEQDEIWNILALSSIKDIIIIGEYSNNQIHILSVYCNEVLIKI